MEFIYRDNEDKPGVYKITCVANGKVYFGETVCFKRREREHRLDLQNGTHWNKHLQGAFAKYGTESLIFEVIEVVLGSREERTLLETKYIQEYVESGRREELFNKHLLTVSAQGPWSLTPEETKKKMSVAQKGRKHSEETKIKMSQVQKGRTFSEETRKKMSESQKKRDWNLSAETRKRMSEAQIGRPCRQKGKKHTEETKIKMSEAHKGHSCSAETRKKMGESSRLQWTNRLEIWPILQLTKEGLLIREWLSIREATDELNISYALISRAIHKGNGNWHAGGFKWKKK